HAGNYNQVASYPTDALFGNDSEAMSVMSYFDGNYYTQLLSFSNYNPATPMIADVVAMQRLYGASTTTRTGDTVYGVNTNPDSVFDDHGSLALTIVDSGGSDT